MALQAGNGGGLPPIVEAHAVDDGAIFHQAEQARAGVAQLRQRRQRAKLGKAKTQTVHLMCDLAILVETCREAHWIGKAQTRDCACRSEEHTSELQSLMRSSYAVFCLKKKTTQHTKQHIINTIME